MSTSASFRATVEKDGVNPYVAVPARVTRALAGSAIRGRVRVAETLQGHLDRAYRIGRREHLLGR